MGSGPPPGLVFDPDKFMLRRNGRSVFRPAKDAVLFSLGHPLIHQALLLLSRARYPGTEESQLASRWTVGRDNVPPGAEAVVALTVEELAVNERGVPDVPSMGGVIRCDWRDDALSQELLGNLNGHRRIAESRMKKAGGAEATSLDRCECGSANCEAGVGISVVVTPHFAGVCTWPLRPAP